MKMTSGVAALLACLTLAACGPNEPPAPKTTSVNSNAEAKKETKPEVPDTHGMPGMSDLFKTEEKAAEKAGEKK